jgi:hypothetical protein
MPDPGSRVKKAPNPGSGSATLPKTSGSRSGTLPVPLTFGSRSDPGGPKTNGSDPEH